MRNVFTKQIISFSRSVVEVKFNSLYKGLGYFDYSTARFVTKAR